MMCYVCIVCAETTTFVPSETRRCEHCGRRGTIRHPGHAVKELLARVGRLAAQAIDRDPAPEQPLTPGHPIGCHCIDCLGARIEAAG